MDTSTGIVPTASSDTAAAQTAHADVPSVIAPIPAIAFGALALGLIFDWLHRFNMLGPVPAVIRNSAGFLLLALGAWFTLRATVSFRSVDTPSQPWRPTRAIAECGIYARTRNPMVQGVVILVLGLAILFSSDWAVLFLMPAAAVLHYGVVLREEIYLEGRFGDAYRSYKAAVPRYGWPFAVSSQARSKP